MTAVVNADEFSAIAWATARRNEKGQQRLAGRPGKAARRAEEHENGVERPRIVRPREAEDENRPPHTRLETCAAASTRR